MSFESFFFANENNILALVVFILLVAFVIINRKKFSIESKVIFIYRTKLGLAIMKKFSRFRKTVNIFGIIGVIAAVATIGFMLYLLVPYLQLMATHPSTTPAGLQLVLPVSGVPGVFGVPIFYWLLALIITVTLHEGAHGVVALSKKIKLKSSGFGFFLGFLPLAFVEPDEKQFAKAKRFDRLKVLSAGSFINLIIGAIFLIVYIFFSNYLVAAHAVSFSALALNVSFVAQNSPAYNAGLPSNTVITNVNGEQFFNYTQLESELSVNPGSVVNLTTSSGKVYSITTGYNPSSTESTHSYIGINGTLLLENYSQFPIVPIVQGVYPNSGLPAQTGYWFDGLFLWIAFISLGLGLANFLPIFYITDGCKIVNELLGYVIKNKKRLWKVTNWIIIAFSVLFLFLTPLGTALFSVI